MSTSKQSEPPSILTPGSSKAEKGPPPPNTPSSFSSASSKKRTRHACDRCRLMRTKCSGGGRCDRCIKDDAVCAYGDHKRERNKKDLADSVSRIKELEDENRSLVIALRQLTASSDFRWADHEDVVSVLARYQDEGYHGDSENSRSRSHSILSPIINTETRPEKGGESRVSSIVGSPGKQGELQKLVDLDNGTGVAGFVGKMSEMAWMQRCHEYLAVPPHPTPTNMNSSEFDSHTAAVIDFTYFVDEQDLLAVDENQVDALQWPSAEAAVIMTEAYFHTVEGSFQFLSRETFINAMYQLSRDSSPLTWNKLRWLALANMIWAIGAKWLHVAKLDTAELLESHLVYYARARALGLDHRVSFDHPDVEMVQGIGNLAFYLLVNGSISRAWTAIGHAVQQAMALGLHLRVTDPSISRLERFRRAQLWFSLYRFQILIAEITGRPQLVRSNHVTVSLETLEESDSISISGTPGNVNPPPSSQARDIWLKYIDMKADTYESSQEESGVAIDLPSLTWSIPREAFIYQIRLCQLGEEIADRLYTGSHDILWIDTQSRIEDLQRGLDAWAVTLPEELKFSQAWPREQNPRAGIQLAMYSYSVSMILHRACLCEIHIENESNQSKEFNLKSARACVVAAMAMIEIMPDEFVGHQLYQLFPWWTMLHYLCQATAILVLELCLDVQHFQGETGRVLRLAWRAVSYLANMASHSMSAHKAWKTFDDLLRRVSTRYSSLGAVDFPQHDVQPPQ